MLDIGGIYYEENKFLIANGYNYPLKNLKALMKNDGNKEESLKFMDK
jgi:hypothetical protein